VSYGSDSLFGFVCGKSLITGLVLCVLGSDSWFVIVFGGAVFTLFKLCVLGQ